jgi:TRAP-type C4-dicarboxylate transport system permease small subunit
MNRQKKSILNKLIDLTAIFIMAVLVLDVVWQVISRYIFKNPSAWTEELAGFLLIWAGLLGACIAHREKAHLGIDYFVDKFSVHHQDLIRILVSILTAVFALAVLSAGGFQLVCITFMTNQYAPALGIPMGYIYLILPLSGILVAVYSLQHAWTYYLDMKSKERSCSHR